VHCVCVLFVRFFAASCKFVNIYFSNRMVEVQVEWNFFGIL